MSDNKNNMNFPIDLVYMWVDDKDPQWIEKRNKYMDIKCTLSNHVSRWSNNDELKYSLRSVELYAPWINHIYIVTDNQRPEWLNTDHPNVDIIDHSQILDMEALPVFNSIAIESCIWKIPGLCEHFIIGNDDTMFATTVSPYDFFTPDGSPIVRLKKHRFNRKKAVRRGIHAQMVMLMQNKITAIYKKKIYHEPHHNFDAYRLSHFKECVDLLPQQWHKTAYNRFRKAGDMHRCYVGYYAIATGKGVMKKVGRYNRIVGVGGAVKAFLTNRYAADSKCFPLTVKDFYKAMRKYNPLMFCMNDGERATDDDRRRMVEFLDKMFPCKSSFEK